MSTYTNDLRNALSQAKNGKDTAREAGQGVWANYVRSTCYPYTCRDVQSLDVAHKALVEILGEIKELSKEEKNSLRSAKCVVGKAITNNVDVWQRTDSGEIVREDELPMPKGKSELQEAKSDYDRMMSFIDQANKKYESDTREIFTDEQLNSLASAYSSLAHAMIQAVNN